jgi:uncharacterized protein YkvS
MELLFLCDVVWVFFGFSPFCMMFVIIVGNVVEIMWKLGGKITKVRENGGVEMDIEDRQLKFDKNIDETRN